MLSEIGLRYRNALSGNRSWAKLPRTIICENAENVFESGRPTLLRILCGCKNSEKDASLGGQSDKSLWNRALLLVPGAFLAWDVLLRKCRHSL